MITAYELKRLIGKVNIIDIRDRFSYNLGNIPTSKNINYMDLMINPEKYLNINEEYYIYCTHGFNSRKVCNYLLQKGYKVKDLEGGYTSYLNS